ncbi:MAG: protein-glutamate O-methyltransferase CheR [Deltaproteobacteria bacterium]|nr:protein-glutamate O-methyltransferase CheR [Deltaproteobacteria bacterium]
MLTLGLNSKPKLSNETFTLISGLIYSRCGIFFALSKKYLLEARLQKRLEVLSLKTFGDYYYYLTYDAEREKEMARLLNTIVTNETSFFRDLMQLDAFRRGVMQRLMNDKEKSGSRNLRLWSAACSTGEEPYTLAMMLLEDGIPSRGYGAEILASDLSDNVLRSAQAGVYDKYSLRNTPEAYIAKYFQNSAETYAVNKKVQELVRYRKINLYNALETATVKSVDVIFCRNVLIYFDDASKKKVLAHLYDSLNKGGYLFVGFSESLHDVTRLFKPLSIERTVVYQKV